MATNSSQNIWFGVSMFLIGLIAGGVLTFSVGGSSKLSFGVGGNKAPVAPTANAPQAPQKPAESTSERMARYADDIGLDAGAFKACVEASKYTTLINEQMAGGEKAGVNGTPGNIIVHLKSKKTRIVSGARPFESFKTEIDDMLANPTGVSKDPNVTESKDFTPVDFKKDHYRGSDDAEIAVVEYSDYECPFCHRVHPTYKQIMDAYGDKVVWVYRHFPLGFHANALPLANGAECANELGGADAFWSFTDKIMEGA